MMLNRLKEGDVRHNLATLGYHKQYIDALIGDAMAIDFTDTPKVVLLYDKSSEMFELLIR